MSSSLESAPCNEYLPEVYRFAFLMTGSSEAAMEVVRRTVERAARGGIDDLRDPRRTRRWLFAEARHHCGGPLSNGSSLPPVPPDAGPGGSGNGNGSHPPTADCPLPATPTFADLPAGQEGDELSTRTLAAAFHALPERERSALILFYLYLFNPADLAETLELPLDTLGPILARGRALLTRELDKPLPLEMVE